MQRTRTLNMKVVVSLFLLVALLVLGVVVQARSFTGIKASVPAADAAPVVSLEISPAEQEAALAFWTRERLKAAKPMEMPKQAGPAEVDLSARSSLETEGPYGFVTSGLAAPDADRIAKAAYPQDWLEVEGLEGFGAPDAVGPDALGMPTGTSQTYTSYKINTLSSVQNVYPHRWVGRLSFSTPGGTSYCSGTAISGNVMLTAAHCLYDSTNNRWYSNWVFTPAYRNGNAPFGTFAAQVCWVLTAWVNLSGGYAINTWAQHDVGVCKMGNNSAGQSLNSAVGWMGREWNFSYIRHVHNMGYPFRDYNNAVITDAGKYLVTCVADTFQQPTEVRGMGCNWGGGISGGPWVRDYAQNVVTGWATGVNSGIFVGTQNIYGARFNSNNIVPLCNSAGC
jgi:hypothetical protein